MSHNTLEEMVKERMVGGKNYYYLVLGNGLACSFLVGAAVAGLIWGRRVTKG